MENEKKEKALKIYQTLNKETKNMLILNDMSHRDVYLEADSYNHVDLHDDVKEAVLRTARAYTQERVMALAKKLENLMYD